ncbi:MAG: ComEC/Rec2 family competence protein [Candidatus Paceibacterota bacterium]|jgi:competence protein ComEC
MESKTDSKYTAKNLFFIFCCICLFCLFLFRFFSAYHEEGPKVFEDGLGQSVEVRGVIAEDPDEREKNTKLVLETNSRGISSGSTPRKNLENSTKIMVTAERYPKYEYGDDVVVSGKLTKPEAFVSDTTGRMFNYPMYLKKDGIFYEIRYPEITVISHDNGNWLKTKLFHIKDIFTHALERVIARPESGLMAGIILGDKSGITSTLNQEFITTGTIHIVALSGYNVTIVADWVMKLFAFLPFLYSLGAGALAIMLFVLMTGASSTAIRAGIMALLALIARATGRKYDIGRALAVAFLIMILWSPLILIYDVSFQLSFLATIALIYVTPYFEKYFKWVPKKFALREIATATTAIYLFVAPFILYQMGTFSFVAIPANLLIVPLVPLSMILGFTTGFFGLISFWLAYIPGIFSYIVLHIILLTNHLFASFSFASIIIPNVSGWFIAIVYGLWLWYLIKN